MIDLYSTRRAAEYLRVSQASVRRWADAGLLPVQRIGRRRERRFAIEDLRNFAEAGRSGLTGQFAGGGVRVGSQRAPLHSHLAAFFDSDAAQVSQGVPFLAEGLRSGQPCLLVAAGRMLDAFREGLARTGGVDVEAFEREGRLTIVPGPGSTARSALAFLDTFFRTQVSSGAGLMRFLGDVASARRLFRSDAELLTFETAMTALGRRVPAVILCQYDVRAFTGPVVLGALRAHPDVFGHPLGNLLG